MFKGLDLSESAYAAAVAAFQGAVDAAGGQTPFAAAVGCTQGNISQLLDKGSVLPGRYVLRAESATGVSRHDLRPDIYPHDMPAAAAPVLGQGRAPVACDRKGISQLGEPAR